MNVVLHEWERGRKIRYLGKVIASIREATYVGGRIKKLKFEGRFVKIMH